MNIKFVIVSLIIFSFTYVELKGCQCSGKGELDLQEYILADLIAEVEVISFTFNEENQKSKTEVRIIKSHKPLKNINNITVFSSNHGGCSYALTSGRYLVWANKNSDETYSITSCSRFLKLYERKNIKTYVRNLEKYKSEKKAMIRFLKSITNKTGYVNLIQDNKIIQGYLNKGMPFGAWEIIDNKTSANYLFLFKNGKMDGIQIIYMGEKPLARSIVNYKNGKLHGVSQSNFVNGIPNTITTYENGMMNGMKYYYRMSGKLKSRGNLINDVREGTWQYFRENGTIEKEVIYELVKENIPQRDLRLDNYSKRQYLIYDEGENLIKKTVYKFNEKVFEQEFN